MKKLFAGVVAGCALAFAGQVLAQEVLTVWWVKGFYKSEDEALFAAIKKFEDKTKVKVELSQYPVQDMIPKTVAALDAGTPPDVAYADVYDFQVTGKWAFDGKLEDISDIITPQKDRFLKNTIETTYLYNDKTKKKAYYAFPIKQQTMHQYWKNMLAEAGFKEWTSHGMESLLGFLVRQGAAGAPDQDRQADLRDRPADGRRLQRLVLFVLTYVDAYNVKWSTTTASCWSTIQGQGWVGQRLKDYTDIRTRGCTPPCRELEDPDNKSPFTTAS
jgi:multiple sugar transport system substrate-binding protein